MSKTVSTISELIDQWPTIADFASAVGCGYEAARQMRRRGSIAPKHWARVVDASAAQGIEEISFAWLAKHAVGLEAVE
ncbi:hypothetical protein [Allorhizobium taibaishanense]|uniref:Transcriptional regulator n=1 Tax=Allorhizobium taibaishanense TaxID=887144 RepID=A0A1Q9A368_9HYPH|nr:hypothetical protein [Allorhizobium taibaishanense]MBB4005829.1 hypothetical protein [Allorhizobium taibaishanense]OLP48877.1 hypothetical protein BJF91_17230 [Allorhizobium taibaishanense]